MHVGKYYPPYPGGMETHLHALCTPMQKRVRQLEVLVANDCRQGTDETVDGVRVRRAASWHKLAGAPICPSWIQPIRKMRPDVLHIHWPNPFAALVALTACRRSKLVMTYHSDVVRQKALARLFDPVLRATLKRCEAIIVTSRNYLKTSPVLGEFRDKCDILPFGINEQAFDADEETARGAAAIRKKLGTPLILGIGRFVYYKGFSYLLEAMKGVDAQLALVGTGPLLPVLQAQAEREGLAHKVHFLGALSDAEMRTHLHACDVFVLPSIARSEAFGIVQLEAMACGKPVLNTDLETGVPSVSVHDVTGLTVKPGDAQALQTALIRLLSCERLRATFGAAGRDRVLQKFTAEKMVDSTLALYERVTGPARERHEVRNAPPSVVMPSHAAIGSPTKVT